MNIKYNILLFSTGLLFREIRTDLSISQEKLALELQTGYSTIRAFENGMKKLSMSKATHLSNVFKFYQFDKLSALLVLIDHLSQYEEYSKQKNAMAVFGDVQLRTITQKLNPVFEEIDRKEIKDKKGLLSSIKESGIIEDLDLYLKGTYNLQIEKELENAKNYITTKLFDKLSSYDFDDVILYMENRESKPLAVTNDVGENWEDDNSEYITEVIGITDNVDSIVSKENIKEFSFSYLLNVGIKYRVMITDENAKENIKEKEDEFFKNFKEMMKVKYKDKYKNEKNFEAHISPIRKSIEFKYIEKNKVEHILRATFGKFSGELFDTMFDNFWAYKIDGDENYNLYISFLSNKQESTIETPTLAFLGKSIPMKDTVQKIREYDIVWENNN